MSKLIDGCIPAHQECPYKDECPMGNNLCQHKGVEHTVPFSCAIARSFEIVKDSKE